MKGNHDGQVQRGEQVRTLVTVKNIGNGPRAAHRGGAAQRHRAGGDPDQRRALRGQGARRRARPRRSRSSTRSGQTFKGDDYPLELAVGDTTLGESVTDKIKVKCRAPGARARHGVGDGDDAEGETRRCARPRTTSALVVGRAPKGTVFKATGKLGPRSPASTSRAGGPLSSPPPTSRRAGRAHGTFKPAWQVTPPLLTVIAPTVVDRRHGAHQGSRARRSHWCATSTSASGTATPRSR